MSKVKMKKSFDSCEKPIGKSIIEEMFAELMPEVRFVDCGVATEESTKSNIKKKSRK